MKANYARSLANTLVYEGGYVDHPADPGGKTMRGVTERVYHAWLASQGKPLWSVRTITEPELQAIYRKNYADQIMFDDLPKGVDQYVFDGAVNSGPIQAGKWLQRALQDQGLYASKIDGIIGAATIEGAKKADPIRLVQSMNAKRLDFLKALKGWKTFKGGWQSRLKGMSAICAKMISEGMPAVLNKPINDNLPAPEVAPSAANSHVKAEAKDAAFPQSPVSGPAAGAGGGGAAVIIKEAQDALVPYTGTGGLADKVFTALVVAGAAVALGGMAYGAYALWKSKKIAKAIDLDTPAGATAAAA